MKFLRYGEKNNHIADIGAANQSKHGQKRLNIFKQKQKTFVSALVFIGKYYLFQRIIALKILKTCLLKG